MDTKRLILFVIFSFSLMLLWDSFQKQNIPVEQPVSVDLSLPEPSNALIGSDDLPKSSNQFVLGSGESIDVNTDLLKLTINTFGGDIRQLNFKKHLDKDSKKIMN